MITITDATARNLLTTLKELENELKTARVEIEGRLYPDGELEQSPIETLYQALASGSKPIIIGRFAIVKL